MSIVYVVAPASTDPRQSQKRQIILRACGEANFTAHYPTYSAEHPSFDLTREKVGIQTADFAFVDVTFERPSCYFELGLIEALGLPVVLVAETGTLIHQTSYRELTRFYTTLDQFEGLIKSALSHEQ